MTAATDGPATDSQATNGPATRGVVPGGSPGIDPRGPRFAAALTSVVLAVALVTGSPWALAFQALIFGWGVALGVTRSPYAWLYRSVVRPRLGPPTELEDPTPPRFAQGVGLVVATLGLLGFALGAAAAVPVAAALALVAALLNAVFGWCMGCELYLGMVRLRARTP